MIITPGTSEHIMRVLKDYTLYEAKFREHLPGLSPGHAEDIAAHLVKSSPGLPAEVAAMAPDVASIRIRAEIQALFKSDPLLAEGPPLGQYLLRLFLTASPSHDRAQIAASIDRMDENSKRRLAVEIKRKLRSEGTPPASPARSLGTSAGDLDVNSDAFKRLSPQARINAFRAAGAK